MYVETFLRSKTDFNFTPSFVALKLARFRKGNGLSKLADDAQQHVASLAALGVNVGSEILVNLLENKLPKNTAEKWEETLDRDEFPKIDDLYEFLYRTAVRVSKRVRETSKRDDDKFLPPLKKEYLIRHS